MHILLWLDKTTCVNTTLTAGNLFLTLRMSKCQLFPVLYVECPHLIGKWSLKVQTQVTSHSEVSLVKVIFFIQLYIFCGIELWKWQSLCTMREYIYFINFSRRDWRLKCVITHTNIWTEFTQVKPNVQVWTTDKALPCLKMWSTCLRCKKFILIQSFSAEIIIANFLVLTANIMLIGLSFN